MKKKLIFIFLHLIPVCVFGQIHPYLQAKTSSSIFVNCKTSNNSIPIVSYGVSPENLSSNVTGSTKQFIDGNYSGNYFYHTVQLINLLPNTKYYYKVSCGSETSSVLNFKTLPLAGQPTTSDGHIRFLIMGDNQIYDTGRFDTLVTQARKKIIEKWGGDPADHIELTFMVGDQVNSGVLDQYEKIHFRHNKNLSGNIPIQTTVGNHETYGSLGMDAYYSHFYLDQMSYLGIFSGNEDYYCMQAGNVLFISLSSEHTSPEQLEWLSRVLNASESDTTVDWILTFSHRPYEAEQYVGDISTWVKNEAVPLCMENEKYFMHVGAHHHIYSRGQFKNTPVYNVISGGTAHDQYWGQSNEQDFDYIQKTIPNWCYQIMEVDIFSGTVDIESYSIGSPIMYSNGQWKQSELVDKFHRYKDQERPNKPTIISAFPDSVELPLLIRSSAFETSTDELLNSTEFQISKNIDFSYIEYSEFRDYENLFGQCPGQPADSTQDLNLGLDIETLTVPADMISNGKHFVRVRHRDRNLEWSDFSEPDSFSVYNSNYSVGPTVVVDSNQYHMGSSMLATYLNGTGGSTDWVGIYNLGSVPGENASVTWQYTSSNSGYLNFGNNILTSSDMYYAAFFEEDGYTEIAPRDTFYYGLVPFISTDTSSYAEGSIVPISVANAPSVSDVLEILKVGHTHGNVTASFSHHINDSEETIMVEGLSKGYYTAKYYFKGEYPIGNVCFFQVGDTITNLWIDQPVYELGEDIIVNWTDAPGVVKDWLGIYNKGDDPNIDPLLIYSYFDGVAHGSKTLSDSLVPNEIGEYFIVMLTNDSYNEVSNRVEFSVMNSSTLIDELDDNTQVYPNPTSGEIIKINSTYPIEYVELYDLNGKLIYRTENVMKNKFSMVNHTLPAGTYIVKIQSNKLNCYKLVVE